MVNKMGQNGTQINVVNESYTLKCDALNLESINKHEIYSGLRIKKRFI